MYISRLLAHLTEKRFRRSVQTYRMHFMLYIYGFAETLQCIGQQD